MTTVESIRSMKSDFHLQIYNTDGFLPSVQRGFLHIHRRGPTKKAADAALFCFNGSISIRTERAEITEHGQDVRSGDKAIAIQVGIPAIVLTAIGSQDDQNV